DCLNFLLSLLDSGSRAGATAPVAEALPLADGEEATAHWRSLGAAGLAFNGRHPDACPQAAPEDEPGRTSKADVQSQCRDPQCPGVGLPGRRESGEPRPVFLC